MPVRLRGKIDGLAAVLLRHDAVSDSLHAMTRARHLLALLSAFCIFGTG
jgi:hypothetical protein